ncbi:hypothetical protein [Ottowia sp.]|uniref:hypothetical protein n=1 Tax=Ottowia sp. TaxID=1898956 RepID=UPI002CF47DD5|nr:hypothetical protein [Ottowia sp.]HOB67768.1 hypothetical protein [Ottowia sp.]HPZ56139.1 hypothetical protein [Ottowia sp.]HQD46723.1 hypothetical protein [Ottowia sp.]
MTPVCLLLRCGTLHPLAPQAWLRSIPACGRRAEQVRRIHQAFFASAFATADVREATDRHGNILVLSTPEQARTHCKSDLGT